MLAAAVLGTALAYMSDDMLNLAIPWIAGDFGATVTDAQWILNAYYVSLVSSVLVAGSVGDIVGHRRVFVAGILTFSLGAVASALAPAVGLLVLGRFVQGVGAAMVLTAGLALVSASSAGEDRGRQVGRFLGLVAAVPALGPFLSGALIGLLSWRWLFVIPLVLPATALIVTGRWVPETRRIEGRRPHLSGAVLIFLTLGSFSVSLISGAADFVSPVPILGLGVALLAGIAFARGQRRAADPLLPVGLLRRRQFVGGNLIWLVACLTSWSAVFFVAVMLQTTLGQTPAVAGLLLTPIYGVMMLGSPLAGRLADRVGSRAPILVGMAVYALGLWLLSRVTPASAVMGEVLPKIVVMAAGMAIFTAPLAAATLGALDDSEQGVASAFNNVMGQLAGLLGVVIVPAAAGLSGVAFDDPGFALGYGRALSMVAVLAALCLPVAAWTFATRRPRPPGHGEPGAGPTGPAPPAPGAPPR